MSGQGRNRDVRFGEAFESLLAAARSGAPWACERLYQGLAPAVAGYLRVQGAAEPDDLASDVFFRVFTHLDSFEGDEDRFRSWVFTIAHHRLIDERRRLRRQPLRADLSTDDLQARGADMAGGDVEDEAVRRLSEERVRRLCERLTPDQRDVLLLRMVGGMSLEQTAGALDRPTGAVKALQHRAVASLRRLLEREGVSL